MSMTAFLFIKVNYEWNSKEKQHVFYLWKTIMTHGPVDKVDQNGICVECVVIWFHFKIGL